MSTLPDELMENIIEYLPVCGFASMHRACQRFSKLIENIQISQKTETCTYFWHPRLRGILRGESGGQFAFLEKDGKFRTFRYRENQLDNITVQCVIYTTDTPETVYRKIRDTDINTVILYFRTVGVALLPIVCRFAIDYYSDAPAATIGMCVVYLWYIYHAWQVPLKK
jgi:hypothetical protein